MVLNEFPKIFLKSAAFSLQTSENNLKPPYRVSFKGNLMFNHLLPLEGAMHILLYGKIVGGIPKILVLCNFLQILMVSDKIIHMAFRTI